MFITDGNNLTLVIHSIIFFSFLKNIIRLSLSRLFHLPFDTIAIASAMRTRSNIANIKHSFVIVFSISNLIFCFHSLILSFCVSQETLTNLQHQPKAFYRSVQEVKRLLTKRWRTEIYPLSCLGIGKVKLRMTSGAESVIADSRAESVIAKIDTSMYYSFFIYSFIYYNFGIQHIGKP